MKISKVAKATALIATISISLLAAIYYRFESGYWEHREKSLRTAWKVVDSMRRPATTPKNSAVVVVPKVLTGLESIVPGSKIQGTEILYVASDPFANADMVAIRCHLHQGYQDVVLYMSDSQCFDAVVGQYVAHN